MFIEFNGNRTEIKDNISLEEFLSTLTLPKFFVVELNNEIIYKENYGKITLKDSDMLEIVIFTGGG